MPHLIAIQADMRLEHYRSAEAFRAKVGALAERAVVDLDDAPRLIAYPETIGLPLLLTLGGASLHGVRTLGEATWRTLRGRWRATLALALEHVAIGPGAFYLPAAVEAYRAYRDAFAEVARRFEATVVAGSIFLPRVEEEAARGLHIADRRVHNAAYVFSPSGRPLARVEKVHLTPGAESRAGLSRGALEKLPVLATPVGRLGVAICLDAFYSGVIDRLDGLGAEVVVQPSANHAPWERPWPPDRHLREGEAWLRHGLRAQIQDRLHLRVGVNPMMVGEVLGLRPRGRSSIVVNLRHRPGVEAEGWPGVLALAESADREEIVRAFVEP